jgi:hypothetical protein
MQVESKKVVARECRFAMHFEETNGPRDMHVVKELLHFEDGTTAPNTRLVYDYKRPIYLVKKGHRIFNDHKEWIEKEKLDKYETTQANLVPTIAKALAEPWKSDRTLKEVCESPYVFGADISAASYIKKEYKDRWPNHNTEFSMAVFDTETDMLHGTEEIIMASITMKNRTMTVIKASFLKGIANPIERIVEACQQYIGDTLKDRKITPIFKIVDREIDILIELMAFAHELQPDFMSVWNLEFDMDKIIEACEKADYSIKDLLSDPKIPVQFRKFRFKRGPAKKIMNSGRPMNFKPSQRWHNVFVPSSFYWIDSMGAYRQIRTGSAEEPSYGLDAIAMKQLKIGKLKFDKANHVPEGTAQWHVFMQRHYPVEYVVYNLWDCIVVELLDEKTLDLRISLPMFAGNTEFEYFNSMPKKSFNEMHWVNEGEGFISGSTASDMTDEMDEETTDIKGWIVMLPSHLIYDNGLRIIDDNPFLRTNIRVFVADLDVTGAYPHNEWVFNVSKATTAKELVSIEGISEQEVRMQTINFSAGYTNALEFCQKMYGIPTLMEMFEIAKHDFAA